MEKLCAIISKYGVGFIIVAGIALLIVMFINFNKLSQEKARIKELLERRNRKYRKNKETHELEEEEDDGSAVTADTIRQCENSFNDLCASHNAFQQLIPVFPLLGILGTVAGLIMNATAEGIEQIVSSVGLALNTTFFGLIAAIILKVFDALLPSKAINDVEVMLDDFDRKLDLADMYDKNTK